MDRQSLHLLKFWTASSEAVQRAPGPSMRVDLARNVRQDGKIVLAAGKRFDEQLALLSRSAKEACFGLCDHNVLKDTFLAWLTRAAFRC